MTLLVISNLSVYFPTDSGLVKAVNSLDLTINSGEAMGIIGESGCGKSVLGLAITRLLQESAIIKGNITYQGDELLSLDIEKMRKIRGRNIGMILQNPSSSLNPSMTIGWQIAEPLVTHRKIKCKKAMDKAIELLERVKIKDPHKRAKQYPHQFSGGMKERALIAMGLANEPQFIIADEPTKGLDIAVKKEIVKLLKQIAYQKTMLIITHDLSVAKEVCDKVGVMYAGELVEIAPANGIFEKPLHPYTRGFFDSIPARGLKPIRGNSPSLIDLPQGCRFHARCDSCTERCIKEHPPMLEHNSRYVRCFLYA
ncbi:MAG: ABC transporter ATP-binding protein [Methanomethylovorans sp.]|jgi:peptide/nickel transport system ATP-binding protein|nr:ABC transporter ATP-binding protein [Methanomethylovorans sp.]